jgi:hypothetical protein
MPHPRRRISDRLPNSSLLARGAAAPDGDPRSDAWVRVCASRIVQIEPQLAPDEAMRIALTMLRSERTAAMSPEVAADFVAAEMSKARSPSFERRSAARAHRS